MLAAAEEKFGGIDILVNNAGNAGSAMALTDSQPFWETEPDEWQHWLRTNLYGVLNASRAVLEGMRQRNYGRIVTVISDAGRVGEARYVVYSAAKAGAAGFTRALARAVGRDGVNVNCVSLSAVRTPALGRLLGNPERVSKMLARYPLGRLGEPEDAANMILFLASDAASWITGQTIPVNGGFSFAV
jgi:3-oxoacyl-[acyl-carrier protein] reductase